jgi:PAS domain S-box-containing protein
MNTSLLGLSAMVELSKLIFEFYNVTEFFRTQTDFISFFYGLALITMGLMCLSLHKQKSYNLPWIWLSLFGLVRGLGEWFELTAILNSDFRQVSALQQFLSTTAYLFLFEFARRGTADALKLWITKWIHIVITAVVIAAFCLAGIEKTYAINLYTFAPICDFWAAAVFFWAARQNESKRRYLALIGIILTLHGIALLAAPLLCKQFAFKSSSTLELCGIPLSLIRAAFIVSIIMFLCLFLHKQRQSDGYVWYEVPFKYAILAVTLNLAIVMIGWVATEFSGRFCENSMQSTIIQKASLASAAIDPSYVKQLKGSIEDENADYFTHIKSQLQNIKRTGSRSNPFLSCRFAYMMGKKGNRIVFLADAEPKGSKDYSPPGQVYDEASAEFKQVFLSGKKIVERQCQDKWGNWVSVSIPIKDAMTNRVVCVLGMDVNAGNWQQKIEHARLIAIFCTAVMSILASALMINQHYRKKSNSQIAAMHKRYESVLRNCGEVIWEMDVQGKLIYVSDVVEKHLGFKADELIGRKFYRDFPGEHRDDYKNMILEMIKNGIPFLGLITPMRHKNGDNLIFETNGMPIFDSSGKLAGFSGTARNITDQMKAEQELIRKEEQFRTLVSNIPGAVFRSTDQLWNMQYVNDRVEMITGYKASDFMPGGSHTYASLVHFDDFESTAMKIQHHLDSKTPYAADYRITHANGQITWVSEKGQGIYDDNGKLLWVDGVIFDVTQRKLMEQELRSANERLRLDDGIKSELVYTVSHELRTPLTIFRNIVSNAIAGAYGPITEKMYDRLNTAQSNVDRLARIVNDFLDLSKLEAGKMEIRKCKLSINSVIAETLESLKIASSSRNVELKIYLPGTELFVDADHDRIIQVLTNLVDNAIKFSPESGGVVNIRAKDLDGEIGIDIEDNGQGIEPDDISKLFNRFVQIKKQIGPGAHGTGLGLAISKQIVEHHGGRIWAESKPGKGANFCFVLPKFNDTAQVQSSSETEPRPATQVFEA